MQTCRMKTSTKPQTAKPVKTLRPHVAVSLMPTAPRPALADANKLDNGKENGNYYIIYWGYIGVIGIMEKTRETTLVCWGNIGIMEKRMETTIVYWG